MHIHSPLLNDLYRYWQSLKDQPNGPRISDFDPLEIHKLLGKLALVEVAGELVDYRIRVWGTDLTTFFGQERSWKTFGELHEVENWEEVYRPYETVALTNQPHHTRHRIVSSQRDYIGYERVLFPLLDDQGQVAQVLAGMTFLRNS